MSGKRWDDVRRRAFLYVSFIATGVALTIPGALLPLLLVRWSMNDTRGGLLLFSFYAVGSFGSYCARGRMNWSIARGALLTVLGAICLGWAGRWTAYGAIALYGLGLSLTMTSISLLLSQRFPEQRRLEMTRLNLVWAIGAALGPWIALRATRGAVTIKASAVIHAHHVLAGRCGLLCACCVVGSGDGRRPGNCASCCSGQSDCGQRDARSLDVAGTALWRDWG